MASVIGCRVGEPTLQKQGRTAVWTPVPSQVQLDEPKIDLQWQKTTKFPQTHLRTIQGDIWTCHHFPKTVSALASWLPR